MKYVSASVSSLNALREEKAGIWEFVGERITERIEVICLNTRTLDWSCSVNCEATSHVL